MSNKWSALLLSSSFVFPGFLGSGFFIVGVSFSLMHAIRIAINGQDLGVMHKTINDRDNARDVGKDFTPFTKWTIGGYDIGLGFITAIDHLEQQVRMLIV